MIKKLTKKQLLHTTIQEAWSFFSNPKNLNDITPKDMSFEIQTDLPDKVYEGLIIVYKLKPLLNIPVQWVTEITHVKELSYFVDEQRKGPYKIWHHEHHFQSTHEGVLMTDILHYDIGKGILGSIAGQLFVHKKVENIFNYRYQILEQKFNIH